MLAIDVESVRLFLHVLAACVWVGGQLTLAALLPVLRRAGADVPRAAARVFGRVGWAAFAVLIATGIWNMASYDAKDADGYHGTIGVKLAFVALSGACAWWHQRGGSKLALAAGGAGGLLFALGALLLGVVLAQ
jgi:hypothetical protein